MKVGYIRISKKDQNPELQRRDLLAAGCEKIFEEQISSRKADRPELRAALEFCREGDELVVWKLDRFGRSLQELIELVSILKERGVEFVSLQRPGHHDPRRQASVPRIRGGRRVRARHHPGEDYGRTGCGQGPGTQRRSEAGDGREEARAVLQDAQEPRDPCGRSVRGGGGVTLYALPSSHAGRVGDKPRLKAV